MDIYRKINTMRTLRGLRRLREEKDRMRFLGRRVMKEKLNTKRIKWYLKRLNEELSNICPECYGTGRVAGDVCPKCDGLGYIDE